MNTILHTKAYNIKIQNFEGPFDLLFHLIEKNKFNIYDIPINEIADQYMDYLFSMRELNLDMASEFLVMAATLLHIKSRMLLPENREKAGEEEDPREELVSRLVEYKKYKQLSEFLKEREKYWGMVFYKLPEVISFESEEQMLEMSPWELRRVYQEILKRNKRKINSKAMDVEQIIQQEKVSLKAKMREIARILLNRAFFRFSEFFSLKNRTKAEVVTGFLAVLELVKLKKARIEQKKLFSEILIYRSGEVSKRHGEEEVAAGQDGAY